MDFFNEMEPMLRTYWFIALPASIVFLFQAIMTLTGMDSTDGLSADFDGDTSGADAPFQLFSFRNVINFLIGFGWGGITFYSIISNQVLLGIVAFLIGSIFLILFFYIIRQLTKLEENNTFRMTMAIGKTGNVYLTVPEAKTGAGIVQVSVNGSIRELSALTLGKKIESGTLIKVIDLASDNIVIVERV